MRVYGDLTYQPRQKLWLVKCEPHARIKLKQVFGGKGNQYGVISIDDTGSNAEDLEWFISRYPLEMDKTTRQILNWNASESRSQRELCDKMLDGIIAAPEMDTILPLRSYQATGVGVLKANKRLLVGDDLGLGKTAIAMGAVAAGMGPAMFVVQTHLLRQWVKQSHKFLKGAKCHIIKQGKNYRLPEHNILVIGYSMIAKWADRLEGKYKLIVFDEAQELRHRETKKYMAAHHLSETSEFCLGLTATPIYNYGSEIWNVASAINPGCLGGWSEFTSEWCQIHGSHFIVKEPAALGAHLAEHKIMLRRRRSEVGRELPPLTKIVQTIEYDVGRIKAMKEECVQLAQQILKGNFTERGQATRQLDLKLRQQTGIAKAAHVASAVAEMVNAGEKVVLCGWHREVYMIWNAILKQQGIETAMYTGTESAVRKTKAVENFCHGDARVFIMSLRSGAGLDGLQEHASIMVKGELDWSPQVHDQCAGRLRRDGQNNPVTVVYMVADGGSDPLMAGVLGLKRDQSEGIINPDDNRGVVEEQKTENRGAALARSILNGYR